MQQRVDVAEKSCWLDFWPGTIQEAEGQLDIAETYEMVTGMCKDEEVEK